jgi:hypothetical protein
MVKFIVLFLFLSLFLGVIYCLYHIYNCWLRLAYNSWLRAQFHWFSLMINIWKSWIVDFQFHLFWTQKRLKWFIKLDHRLKMMAFALITGSCFDLFGHKYECLWLFWVLKLVNVVFYKVDVLLFLSFCPTISF